MLTIKDLSGIIWNNKIQNEILMKISEYGDSDKTIHIN